MTFTRTWILELCLGLAAAACGNSAPSPGTAGDAGGEDAALRDAATTDAASGDAAATGDASLGLVAQCQAAAKHFAKLCAGDDVRPCLWNAYAGLCATGQTQLLVDSMNCLDNTVCRTFSDANQGNACLERVHNAEETSTAKAVGAQYCTMCGGTNCSTVTGTMEIYPYLSDDQLAAVEMCDGGATCTAGVSACPGAAELTPFIACVSGDK
jgi:hypothetical protein